MLSGAGAASVTCADGGASMGDEEAWRGGAGTAEGSGAADKSNCTVKSSRNLTQSNQTDDG